MTKKTKRTQLLVLIVLLLYGIQSNAQSTINVSSNTATINGIIHDYSIGEMTVVSTERTSNLIITQGVLQPTNANQKTKDVTFQYDDLVDFAKVYPNPTSNVLFVELIEAENATIQLYDALGKIVLETKSISQKSSIDLSSFATGNYYLVVMNATNQTQKMSFKIQKIN